MMETTVKVRHLSKSYSGVQAVDDLSFEVGRGQVFGLLGPNGAGKSTSVECILGTKRADSGEISVLGMNPVLRRRELFERVGVQFQDGSWQDKITVSELCRETQCLYRTCNEYGGLLEQFGLAEKKNSPVSQLSGGQRQRLFIVLALIPAPEVVFLDELTTGLDPKARRSVWKCLEHSKNGGMTIILTSHYMDEVETLCDKICILKKGKTVFTGTVSQAVDASPRSTFEDAYLWFTGEEDDERF